MPQCASACNSTTTCSCEYVDSAAVSGHTECTSGKAVYSGVPKGTGCEYEPSCSGFRKCYDVTSCPSGTFEITRGLIDYRISDTIYGHDGKEFQPPPSTSNTCGYLYWHWNEGLSTILNNGNICVTKNFGAWSDQKACPTGQCTVSWTVSDDKPAANKDITVTVKGVQDPAGWQNVHLLLDGKRDGITKTGSTATPTYTYTVKSGSAGKHTLSFTTSEGKSTCTPIKEFTTGGGTCPADNSLIISPTTVKVGDPIIFQYPAGKDLNLDDTWSAGGIGDATCQWSGSGRKYTCTATSAGSGTWNHYWNNKANCGSATYTITGSAVTATQFRVAENPADFTEIGPNGWQDYTADGMTADYTFKDKTPGQKSIFVDFKYSNDQKVRRTTQIRLLSSGPAITGCSLSFESNNITVLNLTGTNFGTVKATVKSGDTPLSIRDWKDKSVKAVFLNAPEGEKLPVSLTNADGQVSPEGAQCSATIQLSLGAKVFCRTASAQDTTNVDLTLTGDFAGGTKVKQKVTISKEGNIAGLSQKLEDGKQYKLSLKAPKSVRKTVPFTAGSGTTNIPNFILPVGDIFPIPNGDGTINTLDKSELNRQWIIAQAAPGRSGDFNGDGRVNSIDWACMRYDFGSSDDSEPVAPSGTVVIVTPSFTDANTFRDFVLQAFGVTDTAKAFIKNNSTIEIADLKDTCSGGGGSWNPSSKKVLLNCAQYEGGLHELSHVWWHTYRLQNPDKAKSLAKDVVRMADGDGSAAAVEFAKGYVNGIGTWKGMYCTDAGCADPHNIKDSDFDITEAAANAKINDWEIYAGLSSWTMGRYKDGSHALPSYMWQYFSPEFKGVITEKPYYDGGHQ